MKNLLLIFAMAFTSSACAAEFNPDLSSMGDTGSGTSGDSGDDTEGDTGSSGTPDMGGSTGDETGSTGDGDTDTEGETDTGEQGFCGDNIVNGNEECDGTDMGGEDCITQGFDNGTASCKLDCTVDTDQCGIGFCPPQPQQGPLSSCEVPEQGFEYCEGGERCLGEPNQTGFCSAECSLDFDCALAVGYAGCNAGPRCVMNTCIYECGFDDDCPNPMKCVWSEVINKAFCI